MPSYVRGRVLWGCGMLIVAASGVGSAGACSSHSAAPLGAGGDSGSEPVTCEIQRDCPDGLLCDRDAGQCVECLTSDDCSSDEACAAGVCRMGCQSDKDCRDLDQLCGDNDVCVDCLTDAHCESGETCSDAGVCQSETGQGGAGSGTGGSNNGGSETGGSNNGGTEAGGGMGGGGQQNGGMSGQGGGGTTGQGGLPGCLNELIDPCAALPHFTGTQTVDGDDSDFCQVPPFTLALASTPYYRGTKPPAGVTTSATVRVGWSATALHIFVRAIDTTPHPNATSSLLNIWNGDNIEFFASPKAPTGMFNYARSYDFGAFQVIAAGPGTAYFPNGQAAFTSTGAASSVPTQQAVLGQTANGYTVEAQIPWTDAAPSAGIAMGFDFGMSDDVDGTYDVVTSEYRNYYGLLFNAGLVGGYCTQHYEPYCDSRNWCTPIAAP